MSKFTTNLTTVGAVLMIMSIIFAGVFEVKNLLIMQKDTVDIMYLEDDELEKNMHVNADIYAIWDMVITETTEQKTYGVTTSSNESSRYYAIPYLYAFEQDGEDVAAAYADYFLIVKVGPSYFDEMEDIMDETNDWYTEWWDAYEADEPVPDSPELALSIEGYTKKLSKEENSYMRNYIEEMGYEIDADHPTLESYYAPYYVQSFDMSQTSLLHFALICLGVFILGVLLVVFGIARGKREKQEAADRYRAQGGLSFGGMMAQDITFNNSFSNEGNDAVPQSQMNGEAALISDEFEDLMNEYRHEDKE